jgi:hypothetical protein
MNKKPGNNLGKEGRGARFLIYGEVLFALFPVIVALLIVSFGYKEISSLFYSSDLSLAAALLTGQTVIRFFSGMVKSQGVPNWQRATFDLTLIFLVSALSLVTYGTIQSHEEISRFLATFQIFIFIIAMIVFLSFGSYGQFLLDKSPTKKRQKKTSISPSDKIPEQVVDQKTEQILNNILEQHSERNPHKSENDTS